MLQMIEIIERAWTHKSVAGALWGTPSAVFLCFSEGALSFSTVNISHWTTVILLYMTFPD